MGYIYKITNLINNKSYIGYTINPKNRFIDHQHGRGSVPVYKAIKKYGIDNFEFKTIAEDIVNNENNYIKKYNTIAPKGYNIIDGGGLPPNYKGISYKQRYGKRWKEEIIKRQQSSKFKHNMPHTEETKKKISQAVKGSNNPMYGKKHSQKTLKLISDKRKGVHVGNRNGNAKKFTLTSPHGRQHIAHGNLKTLCRELGLNFATVRKSYELGRPMRSGWQISLVK